MRTYRRLVLLREALEAAHAGAAPAVVQLPAVGTPHLWIGGASDTTHEPGTVSLVLELPDGFVAEGTATGLLVDEWPELVPAQVANTSAVGCASRRPQPTASTTNTPHRIAVWTVPDITPRDVDRGAAECSTRS
jgi:hypothetical protein